MSALFTDSTKVFSNHLNRQIAQYSIAAAVAGVSVLAMASPAAGEVVITRKTIPIPLAPYNVQDSVKISMANNGIDNFSFGLAAGTRNVGPRELVVLPVDRGPDGAHNQIMVGAGGSFYAKALALERGVNIGPAGIPFATFFSSSGALVAGTNADNGSYYSRGFWAGNLKNHYLGVRFQINGKFHYGWIRLTVTANVKLEKPTLEATITGYAYETVANKPILAGTAATAAAAAEKPAAAVQVPVNIRTQSGPSLGMLAAGADAMPVWRREETLASK